MFKIWSGDIIRDSFFSRDYFLKCRVLLFILYDANMSRAHVEISITPEAEFINDFTQSYGGRNWSITWNLQQCGSGWMVG